MKTFTKLLFIFAVCGAFQSITAQSLPKLTFLAKSKVDTATAQIALSSDDETIGQVRIISEQSGKPLNQTHKLSEVVFITVELEEGVNRFTLLAYDKAGNLDNSAVKSIVITRIPASTDENVRNAAPLTNTGGAAISSSRNNFQSEQANPNTTTDNTLRLNGERKIKDNNKISLEIDASKIDPLVGNYLIEVKDEDNKIIRTENRQIVQDERINQQKTLQTEEVTLAEGINNITVYTITRNKLLPSYRADIKVFCQSCSAPKQSFSSQKVIFRSIIGYEQSGASSARSEQHPFLNFFFNTPIDFTRKVKPKKKDKTNKQTESENEEKEDKTIWRGFSVWGDIRLTTTPVQGIGSLADFTPAAFATNFVQGDSTSKVNDLVKGFDFLVGIEQEVIKPGKLFSGSFSGRTSLSLIGAVGAITPLSSGKSALYYKIPTVNNGMEIDPRFRAFFTGVELDGKTNVAFVTPDRDRFFRQYYGGFRLKTFFDNKELENFPATFDITFGQNEAITNSLTGVILRLDGSTPFSLPGADFLYLFGSVNMKLGKKFNESIPPFFLEPATGVSLSDNDTAVISIDRSPFQTRNRDIFRIGVGINLFKLFKKDDAPKKQ